MKYFKRTIRKENGSELIEFIGLLPLLIFMALLVVQLLMAGQTILVANSAAREGVRAAVTCEEDVGMAVVRAAPGFRPAYQVSGGQNVTVVVVLSMPIVPLPFVGKLDIPIRASATMRMESTRCNK